MLHDFITTHRDEIVRACKAELSDANGPERLEGYIGYFLDEVLRWLKQDVRSVAAHLQSTLMDRDDRALASACPGNDVQQAPHSFGAVLRAVAATCELDKLALVAEEQLLLIRCLEAAVASSLEALRRPAEQPSRQDASASRVVGELRLILKNLAVASELARSAESARAAQLLAEKLVLLQGLTGDCLRHAEEQARPAREPRPAAGDVEHDSLRVLGSSAALARVRSSIDQLSRRSRAPVLIVGDPGSGRRHCARALHRATYPDGDFVELRDAASIAQLDRRIPSLRAWTNAESAVGLTAYVHELGESAECVQARLSSLMQDQGLQLRLIASSSRKLTEAARHGSLRSDLVFRFPSEIRLPALSECSEDIPELARHFAALAAWRAGAGPTSFTRAALAKMQEHRWPGNLVELSALIERLAQEFGEGLVDDVDLPELGDRCSGLAFSLPSSGIDFAELERQLLVQALAMAQNNQTRAAALLSLTRDQMRYRMAKFGILALAERGG